MRGFGNCRRLGRRGRRARRFGGRRGDSLLQRLNNQINQQLRIAAIRIEFRIVSADIKSHQLRLPRENRQRLPRVGQRNRAERWIIRSRKFAARNHVDVEVQYEFALPGVRALRGVFGRDRAAALLNFGGQMPRHRRTRQILFFACVDAIRAEQQNVGFAHQRRFAPETHHLRRAASDDV
jgi:hypothetical protein